MKSLKEWVINVAVKQGGIDMPTGCRLVCSGAIIMRRLDDSGFDMIVELDTYLDNTYSKRIFNDAFPGNRMHYDLGSTLPSSSIKTLVKNAVNPKLDNIYGTGNYTEV